MNHHRSSNSGSQDGSHDGSRDGPRNVAKDAAKSAAFNPYPFWSPRFWSGMTLSVWWKTLARYRFRVRLARAPMAVILMFFAGGNSFLKRWQRLPFGKQIAGAVFEEDPIFILGHWRSGTTYLHELLSLDDRFASPTTYEVYAPHHFLLTEWLVARFFPFLIPSRRPMDNVAVGVASPQEDEWALCNLGVPSPYLRVAFSGEPPRYLNYFNFEDVSPDEIAVWKNGFLQFMRAATVHHEKRLVLKSPGHTGRLRVLLELFPRAKFVHIVRDPFVVFPSTLRMWRSFDHSQSLQKPNEAFLEEFVLDAHNRIYTGFERDRSLLQANQLHEIRYEELIRDPVAQMEAAYQTLDLHGFDKVRPKMETYVEIQRDYRPNRHEVNEDMVAKVATRWKEHVQKYGYERG